jgi:cell wall-associated NlpC family hydrolase
VARFVVEATWDAERLLLTGATDQPGAMDRLGRALAAHRVPWEDQVRRLPDEAAGSPAWALVNNSVANLRSEPRHPAELATQAPLGTPLRILDRDGGWLLVQVPDGYIAWVDGGAITRVTADRLDEHRTADKVIYLRSSGVAVSRPSPDADPVADLVAGALIERLGEADGFHHVRFPDGREAWVPAVEAEPFADWLAGLQATESSLVAAAMTLLGRPYLWGGTSPKGMDCSGFTKTAFLLNGMILPRDASQQVFAGAPVGGPGEFHGLRPGDLLFFGRPATDTSPRRVVHVGMWIGGTRFIHSSGNVQIGSVDPADPLYDEHNTRRHLGTRRMLGHESGIHHLADQALYPHDGRFAPAATAGPAAH